jgi:hypothetical protein
MVQSHSSQVRVIPKDLAAELGGQGGQPFRVSQKLLLALANTRRLILSCVPAGRRPSITAMLERRTPVCAGR